MSKKSVAEKFQIRENVRLSAELEQAKSAAAALEAKIAAAAAPPPVANPPAPIVAPTLREQLGKITNPFEQAAFVLQNEAQLSHERQNTGQSPWDQPAWPTEQKVG